ncbi:carbohydrate binding domain-containing protein [Streptomyces sp. NPDC020192]|uniref:carbohydrate binding domain-containing protein n=1 Tax=Streptomyces sp. NPDC020192 TaxID=3365066 RepID=UPI003798ABF4
MTRPRSIRALLTGVATLAASAGLALSATGTAQAATPLPAHVFAPYFEAYSGDSPAALSQASGAKYLTMAFLQADKKGSCTPYWNGDTGRPVDSSVFGSDFSTIRSRGGDVIPSLGGYAADNGGTEIADSCTNVDSIAAAYEKIITTYDVSRLDMDVEDNSLTDTAGIDRRNQAIKKVQDWAAANRRSVPFSYTLPTTTTGLADSGLAVLRSAKNAGAKVDVVNIMTFDYYDGATHHMATDTQTAASGLHDQLASLYPNLSDSQLWNTIGVTEMPGVDDYGPAETFTTADATSVYDWAVAKGINTLSFWALQRDNGGCPGGSASDTCSGIAQDTWYFSHTFEPFTGGTTTPPANDFSVSLSPGTAAVAPGGTTTAAVRTSVTSGSAQSVDLAVSGAPSGVTASLSPTSVTAGGTSTLTVRTSASTAPGTYPLTVTGTAGPVRHSSTFTLTVNGSGGGTTVLTNGDFETGSLTPWTCDSGTTVVSSPVHGGSHALKTTPSASRTGQCTQTLALKPDTAYTLSGWVQGPYAYLGVSGGATADTWASATSWSKLTVPFTTGSSGTVTVYVHGWYGQGSVYADDLTLG